MDDIMYIYTGFCKKVKTNILIGGYMDAFPLNFSTPFLVPEAVMISLDAGLYVF